MPSRFWLKLAAIATAIGLVVALVNAWRADRRDRAQLAAELAATRQLLTQADARQGDRDARLNQTLTAIAAEKRAAVTPAQILGGLQKSIPLPAPIALQPDSLVPAGARFSLPAQAGASPLTSLPPSFARATCASPTATASDASPASTNDKSAQLQAVLPAADLKPLYDFTLDCQACQAKLSAAQGDLADEKVKTAALSKERDAAVRIAKGGSAWRRAARAAKWFLLGAAAGAVAAKSRH